FPATHQVSIPLKGQYSTSYTLYNRDTNTIRNLCEEYPGITFCPINIESDAKSPQNWFSDQLTVAGSLINFSVLGEKCQVMLPKLVVPKNYNKLKLKAQLFETQGTDTILDYGLYIAVQCNSEGVELNVLNNGTRGRLLTEEIELNNHILVEYEQSLFDSEWERMKRCIPTLEKNYCQVS
ncbi:hypothetical protein, partial [Paraglaciecola sp.]|uniref:hypothetical protein n=1 Tax=Paraglaciecola sp. TaxID=1920173 RepID=UPI003EF392FB